MTLISGGAASPSRPQSPSPSSPRAIDPRELTAGDLLLRPFTESDEAAVGRAMEDPGILRWAAGLAVNGAARADRARVWLAPRLLSWQYGSAPFAVTDAASGELLGYVTVRDAHRVPGQAEAAYWVTPAARGRAVAARALDAAARWAFAAPADGGLGVHRISLDHSLANPGSCRVAARAGFPQEGVMRDFFLDPAGERHDSHLHARLATDDVVPPTSAL
ncbi:GNAT family N-acetyltransferase [Actinacidiphila alni]|uniref:GNAT family N-acetyltransferase n=1 Tax=Actinacidiphila alni TaxID=380248 RepID=UPI003454C64F